MTDNNSLSSSSKALIPRFVDESPDRWLRIRPSIANTTMQLPPILLRGTIAFDTDSPHLVIPPDITNTGMCGKVCHVYLNGTGCNPTESNVASWFVSVTGDRGIATIALSYQWGPYADKERNEKLFDLCQGDNEKIQEALYCYHHDTIVGGSSSGIVHVTPCNSIEGRLVALLRYLSHTRPPEEQWSSFLDDNGHLVTEKFVFSGHSQGSGHVCAIAKMWPLKKAVLLSGPQEHLAMPLPPPPPPPPPRTTTSTQRINNNTTEAAQNDEESESSWLDGPYETDYMVALMHVNEEQTADLIRQNWTHIAPLQHNGNGRMTTLDANTIPALFGSDDRMFSSTIASFPGDAGGGRPNHMSIFSDRNTPVTTKKVDNNDSTNNQENEWKVVPVYYDLIWTHLLLQDVVPIPVLSSKANFSRSNL